MVKKIAAIFLLLVLVFSLCACSPYSKELSERLIVSAAGIDFDGESYVVSVVCLSTSGSSAEGTSFNSEHIESMGETLHEAFSSLSKKTNKSLFWGQATAIILGENAVKERLSEILSFLADNEKIRMNISVSTVASDAKTAVFIKTEEGVTVGDELEELYLNKPQGFDCGVKLYELTRAHLSGGYSGFIPIVSAEQNEIISNENQGSEPSYRVAVKELLIINKNSVFGAVDAEGFIWALALLNRVERLETQFKQYRVELISPNTSISFDSKNATLSVEFYATAYVETADGIERKEMKREITEYILKNVREAFEKTQKELGIDMLNILAILKQNGKEDCSLGDITTEYKISINLTE